MTRPSTAHGEPADEAFGRAVKMVMFQRRITNRRLALTLGIHESALGKKLHGERPWTLTEMIATADWLRVDLRDLLGQMWTGPSPATGTEEFDAGGVQSTRRKVDGKGLAPVIPLRPRAAA